MFPGAEPFATFTTPSLYCGLAGRVGCGERGRSFRMASRGGANRIEEPAAEDAVRAGRSRARRSHILRVQAGAGGEISLESIKSLKFSHYPAGSTHRWGSIRSHCPAGTLPIDPSYLAFRTVHGYGYRNL